MKREQALVEENYHDQQAEDNDRRCLYFFGHYEFLTSNCSWIRHPSCRFQDAFRSDVVLWSSMGAQQRGNQWTFPRIGKKYPVPDLLKRKSRDNPAGGFRTIPLKKDKVKYCSS